ncbi:sodium:proton symporter [Anoxybacillus gonensis]|uniref:Bile acid:sodium symporter n=1 Tax=Anoxybacillus gonensis TaxID=198467 RepID=A0AAW7TP58_9BACL|nr:bile acid:sodium symporter [Anoxybacillus gonensis]AKS37256.1 sodium:proton symporter [Anoxybacillus gonensis]KGP62090.1 sodium:proton symporter [Anoxybacillus gonensis]MCX8047027.1 bile acid:sodium symporter [Anoxybacillus gonensis]MDO0878600.1 bile acid:sodium symporter [Anoxybacillus gonensis]
MKKLYFFPQKHLLISVPATLLFGFIVGTFVDTSFLKSTILFATIIMIYATMVGFKWKELTHLKEKKILFASIVINFIIIPFIAFLIGKTMLQHHPIMFAGLALSALLPTSGMTISWTAIQKGNMAAAVKLTVFGLVLGSLLTPWYLLVMVGKYVDINVMETFRTILLVVFVPMILGHVTFKWLMRKYTPEQFQKQVKPNFAPLSIWAMLYVVFVSISMRAKMIVSNLQLIVIALAVLLLFYFVNYVISTLVAKQFFNREDGIALVNGTVLRNLSIAIGLAATSFGAEAALIVTLAFIVQQQSIAYYGKIANQYWFKQ